MTEKKNECSVENIDFYKESVEYSYSNDYTYSRYHVDTKVEAPTVSADSVCKLSIKESCGVVKFNRSYDPCKRCVRDFFLSSFPETADKIQSAEKSLDNIRLGLANGKRIKYNTWWKAFENVLKLRSDLYFEAIDAFGYGQVMDDLDPCEDMHNRCDKEMEFLYKAVGKSLLILWGKWSHYGLNKETVSDKDLYSTKNISGDTF